MALNQICKRDNFPYDHIIFFFSVPRPITVSEVIKQLEESEEEEIESLINSVNIYPWRRIAVW